MIQTSLCIQTLLVLLVASHSATAQEKPSSAWRDGRFYVNVAGVVSRSDIILQRPNQLREQALPLGNGRLGVAIWSEGGLRLQLNRADTLPGRLAPGQVLLTGLQRLVDASDYAGRLDLYRGEFKERGAGLTATIYVEPDSDKVVVIVTGADPNSRQTASLYLWKPRSPVPLSQEGVALLSETWKDSTDAGASGETFGSLAAITADARDLHTEMQDPLTVKLSFLPKADGSFRLFVAAPEWKGGDAIKRAKEALNGANSISVDQHEKWWKDFWDHAGLMRLSSADGSAEYFENLRCIDLFTAAAESLGAFPGSHGGIGDLFSSLRDEHRWDPSAYWHWNSRMQVAANLGAGLFRLNDSYFNLYRSNLQNILDWTKSQMQGRPGVCVPETMRFNGKGYENEAWLKEPGLNCSAESKPYYNARTLTTGAEVSLWVWQQYLMTQDKAFLSANYPLMAASARFLLAYAKQGSDGLYHTYPSNAHETQWDVHDPTTDIAAMKSLFPAIQEAARILKTDPELVREIDAAKLPSFALMNDMIAQSYDPKAEVHNTENIGLEAVWPYSLIGDTGPLHSLAVQTYLARPNKFEDDWSSDPIQAARLGLAEEMKSALFNLTEKYQEYPSGLAKFMGPEFYVEQIGVVTAALQEALVQDYDGLVRIAPAWPKNWDVDGRLYIQQKSRIDVQIHGGILVTVAFEAGASGHLKIRNPWPGKSVEVVVRGGKRTLLESDADQDLDIVTENGQSYLIQPVKSGRHPAFREVDGSPATRPKSFATRHIGLP